MKQVWISRIGGPEVLEVREAPDPEATKGQIRIRVKASGINFADIMARMGQYPDAPPIPTVTGYEVAGVVDQVGEGGEGFAEGDRVLSFTRFGGHSDVIVSPPNLARKLPDSISFEKAAAIPVNYATAWVMLVRLGNIQPGETALVHAAAGGVGQAALQICTSRGASVIGTASSAKHARLTEMGAQHCIDYRTQDFEREVKRITNGRGVDVVLDAVGGKSFRKSYRCLAPLGRLYFFGVSSFVKGTSRNWAAIISGLVAMPWFHPLPMMNANKSVAGVNLGHLWEEMERLQPDMDEILQLTAKGTFDPVVDKVFPFSKAGDAHAYMQDRKNFGKVLIAPDA